MFEFKFEHLLYHIGRIKCISHATWMHIVLMDMTQEQHNFVNNLGWKNKYNYFAYYNWPILTIILWSIKIGACDMFVIKKKEHLQLIVMIIYKLWS